MPDSVRTARITVKLRSVCTGRQACNVWRTIRPTRALLLGVAGHDILLMEPEVRAETICHEFISAIRRRGTTYGVRKVVNLPFEVAGSKREISVLEVILNFWQRLTKFAGFEPCALSMLVHMMVRDASILRNLSLIVLLIYIPCYNLGADVLGAYRKLLRTIVLNPSNIT
jgi:hypothetical protein